MRNRIQLLATLFALSAPAAFAAGGGESSIFGGDLGNVIWTFLIFILVFVVLGKFAWGPLLAFLKEREDFIRESLQKAKEERETAEERLAAYEKRLADARAEATSIVEEGRRDAEVLRKRIEEEAREESDKMIARAKREISIAQETATKELYTAAADLATEIASRVVGRELQAKDHERLISEAIAAVEGVSSNDRPVA